MTGAHPNVSGEQLVVLPGEAMVRLVGAAATVASANLGRFAIIGGVAVVARLGQAHRATADVDAVVDEQTPPPTIETLLALPGAQADPTGPHRVLIDGIKVEIQGTEPYATADLDGMADEHILYVGAHRYALESATRLTLVASASQTRATVPTATPGALLAMKLHAIEDRRPSGGLDKRASDAWDIYRLLLDLDAAGIVRRELAALPQPLRGTVARAVQRILIDRADRTSSWLRAGDERMAVIAADELEALGRPVVAATS
jgi:hypothetical protein